MVSITCAKFLTILISFLIFVDESFGDGKMVKIPVNFRYREDLVAATSEHGDEYLSSNLFFLIKVLQSDKLIY